MQPSLFDAGPEPPVGFRYRSDFLSPDEEFDLLRYFREIDFKQFRWHEYVGKRRTVTFGWSYDFDRGEIAAASQFPEILLPYRQRAADWIGLDPDTLVQGLITEYEPGAALGWHRDAPPFGIILGISLASDCRFRFRLEDEGTVREFDVERRSVYAMSGPARTVWQHGLRPARELRYSITFRTLRPGRENLGKN